MNSIEKSGLRQKDNPLHNEHLQEGIKLIIVSFDTIDAVIYEMYDNDDSAIDVDHYAACVGVSMHDKVTNETSKVGVISTIDENNKFSDGYRNCIGLVAVGQGEKGTQTSFILHIDPMYLKGKYDDFSQLLTDRLTQLLEESIERSVDVVVYGGRIPDTDHPADFDYELEHYQNAINILGTLVQQSLGYEPVVMPPKPLSHNVDTVVYFDTDKRRLYLAQTPIKRASLQKAFLPSKLNTVTPKYIDVFIKPDGGKGEWED